MVKLTKVPSINTPPQITTALTAALAPTLTAVPALAPTSKLYVHCTVDVVLFPYNVTDMLKSTLNAKFIPKNDTGGGNGMYIPAE